MKSTLIDAGPLIALFNSWPVMTEVSHMLSFNVQSQIDFLQWIHLGGLQIREIITIDSDYCIYRTIHREMLTDIFSYK